MVGFPFRLPAIIWVLSSYMEDIDCMLHYYSLCKPSARAMSCFYYCPSPTVDIWLLLFFSPRRHVTFFATASAKRDREGVPTESRRISCLPSYAIIDSRHSQHTQKIITSYQKGYKPHK